MKTLGKVLTVVAFLAIFILSTVYLPILASPVEQADPTTAVPPDQAVVEIEPALTERFVNDGESGYLIYFRAAPDLSPADNMSWEERGWFVMEKLQAAAEASQGDVRAYLDGQGVKYQSFWIDNIIAVENSSRSTLNGLLAFNEIEIIRAPRLMHVIEPEKSVDSVNAPNAVEPNIAHVLAPNAWADGYRGEGMVVANIDTGVRSTHQALVRQYRGTSSGSHNYNWLGAAGGSLTPVDDHGHGTHTMGTIVGEDATLANQIGVAPGAQWIACDGCEGTGCPDVALLTCAQWIAAPYPIGSPGSPDPNMRPNVVNNSWGDCGQSYDNWYEGSITAWHAAGVYPVFSNGNASNCGYPAPPGLNTVGNPARSGNVTGVGSSGRDNGLYATHSNWGPTDNPDTVNPQPGWADLKPQVLAPGVNIRSSTPGSDTEYQGGWSGTSMSAPHVTGLVALMMQAGSCLVDDYAAVETIIENTATPIYYNDGSGVRWPNYATGWGEINVEAAVEAASTACGPDFKIGAAPAELAVCVPDDAVYNVTVDHLSGFNGTVAFTADVPAGASASFVPSSVVTPTTQSVLTIDTAAAAPGSYTVVITGTSVPTPTHSTSVGLDLYTVSPAATTLTTPADNAVDVPLMPTFSWTAVAQAGSYYLEVATDAAFTNVVYTATVAGASHTMTGMNLDADTLYYWRVSVTNACGSSAYSPVYSFTSVLLLCSTPNVAIPDNTTIYDTLTSGRPEPLADLNVSVKINHTWIGDLDIVLTHQDTSSQAELLPVSFSCSGDNIDATFDDEAANPITCVSSAVPALSGDVRPSGNLGVFDYEALAGAWQLAVHDGSGGDSGTLVEWCLEPTFAVGVGAVAGTVTDANTTDPIAGVSVTLDDGVNTYNALTNGAGEYSRAAGSGTYTVTAALTNYVTAQATGVTVTGGVTTTQDFALDAGQLTSDADDFAASIDLATSITLPWNLSNTGTTTATYDIRIIDNGYSPSAAPQAGEDVLVVAVDSAAATAMETALTTLGYTYLRVSSTVFQGMTVPDLLAYQAVFHTGSASAAASQNLIMAYLDAGGAFYISDNDFGYFNGTTTLYQTYLQSTFVSDNPGIDILEGEDFMTGLTIDISADPWPDDFTVNAEGTRILRYQAGNAAGVAVDRLGYKAVYTSFDFDDMATATQELDVMTAVTNFLMNSGPFWLSTDIEDGVLAMGADQDIVVTMDANQVALAGKYYANLVVRNNTPYGDLVIPVTMTVGCPTCGTLAGDITDAFTSDPLVAAIQITNTSSFDYTINGSSYSIDLPPDTYYLSVTAPGYLSETATAVVTQGVTTTTDFDLTPAFAGLVYSPPEIEEYMEIGEMVTNTVTVTNTGTIDLDFNVNIGGFGGPGLLSVQKVASNLAEARLRSAPAAITSADDCAAYENYAGREPEGYAEFCLTDKSLLNELPSADILAPTDTGYAQDIGYISDNFVSFTLNNFTGQTVLGTSTNVYYGMDFDPSATTLYALENATAQLGTINTANGAFTPLVAAPAPGGSWTGLSIDPTDGTFYASTATGLYTLNPTTGASTLVGNFTGPTLMIDIAVGPDGMMYGHAIDTDAIYTINKATGASTLVGPTGYNANFAQGMDFDNGDGTLYIFLYQGSGANVYGTVNLSTGAVTPLATSAPQGEFEGAIAVPGSAGPTNWAYTDNFTGATVLPGETVTFDVVFDATSLFQLGDYTADLSFSGNFNNMVPTMPLTMHLSCSTCGILEGDITDADTSDPLVADINITGPGGFDVTITDSSYQLAVTDGGYTITVSAAGYLSQTATVTAVTNTTVTTDFALRPAEANISVDPQAFDVTLALGNTATYPLDIINDGAVATDFELREQPVTVRGPLADLIIDGSFEAGTPNPNWTEASTNFGTPLCDAVSCGTGGGTAGPHTGNWWVWMGGIGALEEGSVAQDVVIPVGTADLSFYFWIGTTSGSASDYFNVQIDGTEVFRAGADEQASYSSYTLVNVDVSAYADGNSHEIKFYGYTNSASAVNFNLDDVVLESTEGSLDVIWLSTNPITGTVAADSVFTADVIFDSTVLTQTGVYNAILKVLTDDPVNGTINVPITLTVTAVPNYGVILAPATDAMSGAPGEVVTYTLTLTNSGDVADTFSLAASTSTFATTLSTSSVALAAGASTTVEVYVTIPAGAADGDDDMVTITATSQGDPGESAASTLTTTVEWLKLYMPVIMKQ